MAETLNICGVAVYLAPDARKDIAASIEALPGVELQGVSGECRLAATIVDTPDSMAIDQIAAIHRMPGVVAASLVYHAVDTPDDEIDSCEHGTCEHDAAADCAGASQKDGVKAPVQQLQIR